MSVDIADRTAPADAEALERRKLRHWFCWDCWPQADVYRKTFCGKERAGAPRSGLNRPPCVVCDELRQTHECGAA